MLITVSEKEYEDIIYDRCVACGINVLCRDYPEFMKSWADCIQYYIDKYKE